VCERQPVKANTRAADLWAIPRQLTDANNLGTARTEGHQISGDRTIGKNSNRIVTEFDNGAGFGFARRGFPEAGAVSQDARNGDCAKMIFHHGFGPLSTSNGRGRSTALRKLRKLPDLTPLTSCW
jgi:hypothetical protein